eukprot:TRINITY_DN92055_c0_g1_i1.p1 TRINITY_DN92055_c0_g1~~TRINITY_DN92055_c0_g1_i1.p1  ORF type:complete len:774 (+),score=171.97 TRINITY_DN92055_c0_g1_i1:64-2385(+)
MDEQAASADKLFEPGRNGPRVTDHSVPNIEEYVQRVDSDAKRTSTPNPQGHKQSFLQRGVQRMTYSAVGSSHLKTDLQELRTLIELQGHGSLLRGWRLTFDPRGEFQVDYDDFCRVAGSMFWVGDMQGILGQDGDLDSLTLSEIAPVEGALMKTFQKWIKERHGSVLNFFASLEKTKEKVNRETFVTAALSGGFEGTQEEVDLVFDCCDTGDVGSILKEDIIFLELDPKIRQQERIRKGGFFQEWKNRAAVDFLMHARNVNSAGDPNEALPAKHRLAPRPWQAHTFDAMPMVVSQRRKDRDREERFRQKVARNLFLRQLCSIYGNEVRGIRRAVASDGCNVSLMDLRKYCRKVDLPAHVRDLWSGMDVDGDGKIALEELNPSRARALAKFQVWAYQTAGGCVEIWSSDEAVQARAKARGIGSWMSDTKMKVATFAEALDKLGCPYVHVPEERNLLFSSLDSMGCGLITEEDLEWLDRWDAPAFLAAEPNYQAWSDLKELLVKIHGHPLRAWRKALDRDNSNRIAWVEFKEACKKVRFTGDVGGAWLALDEDMSGYISMREYDPPSETLLSSFKEWSEQNFGSVKLCFKVLDNDRSGSVTFAEMKRACHKLKWHGNVRTLFDCIDLDSADRRNRDAATGKRAITYDELAFLDSWSVEPTADVASLEDFLADSEAKKIMKMKMSPSQALSRRRREEERAASAGGVHPATPTPESGNKKPGLRRLKTSGHLEGKRGVDKLPHCEASSGKSLSRSNTAPALGDPAKPNRFSDPLPNF